MRRPFFFVSCAIVTLAVLNACSGGGQTATPQAGERNNTTQMSYSRSTQSVTPDVCIQGEPDCGHPTPTPVPTTYPYQLITGTYFSVSHNPTVYTITVKYSNGKQTVATSTDGGDTYSIVLLNGQTQYWRLEAIRDANNMVSLLAQEVTGPNSQSTMRHAADANINAANCAVAGAVGSGIGVTIGVIAGRTLGPEIGAVIGVPLGPVGAVAGAVLGQVGGPAIGSTLGGSVGNWLGTYACSAFYSSQPTPTPTPIPSYNPGRIGGPGLPALPPFDGGNNWTFPQPIQVQPSNPNRDCGRQQATQGYWTRYAQDTSPNCASS